MKEQTTMKVYIVTNRVGLLMGAFRDLNQAKKEMKIYSKNCVSTEPDIMLWELTSEQVDRPINNIYKCLKIDQL